MIPSAITCKPRHGKSSSLVLLCFSNANLKAASLIQVLMSWYKLHLKVLLDVKLLACCCEKWMSLNNVVDSSVPPF